MTHDTDARRAADAFGVQEDARLTFVKARENVVFRVQADGLDAALRLHRPGYRTDAELRSEAAMLSSYAATGLRVPEPISAPGGDVISHLTDHAGSLRQATMQRWFPDAQVLGTSAAVFLGTAPEVPTFREMGRTAALLHAVTAPAGYARPAWDAAGLVGPRALWGDPARLTVDGDDRRVIRDALRGIGGNLAVADRDRAGFGVIHADLTFENVLVSPAGLSVIDFDDSGEGWFAFDLATPMFWCSRHPEAEAILRATVDGYRSVRKFDPPAEVWHSLLLARGLSYLGWAADRPGDPASVFIEERVVPWVMSGARTFLDTGETGWPTPRPSTPPHRST